MSNSNWNNWIFIRFYWNVTDWIQTLLYNDLSKRISSRWYFFFQMISSRHKHFSFDENSFHRFWWRRCHGISRKRKYFIENQLLNFNAWTGVNTEYSSRFQHHTPILCSFQFQHTHFKCTSTTILQLIGSVFSHTQLSNNNISNNIKEKENFESNYEIPIKFYEENRRKNKL